MHLFKVDHEINHVGIVTTDGIFVLVRSFREVGVKLEGSDFWDDVFFVKFVNFDHTDIFGVDRLDCATGTVFGGGEVFYKKFSFFFGVVYAHVTVEVLFLGGRVDQLALFRGSVHSFFGFELREQGLEFVLIYINSIRDVF